MQDMNKRFELFNSKGAMVQLDQDGRNMFTVIGADVKVVRQEQDTFWIAWREIWYFNSSCSPGHTHKIVEILRQATNGQGQWTDVILNDDRGYTFRFKLISDPRAQEDWDNWQHYLKVHEEEMNRTDKKVSRALKSLAYNWHDSPL